MTDRSPSTDSSRTDNPPKKMTVAQKQQEHEISARAQVAEAAEYTTRKTTIKSPSMNEQSMTILAGENGAEWELTWPIWHMLSHTERKEIANRHKMTIGDFEEHMTLHRAEMISSAQSPYRNESIYQNTNGWGKKIDEKSVNDDKESNVKIAAAELSDDDQDNCDILSENDTSTSQLTGNDNDNDTSDMLERGGQLLILPTELLHRIMYYLDIDYYHIAALVHPYWSSFTRNEQTYKILCQRAYLNQSKRKQLHVQKFQNSYRRMLTIRPRLRTGCGIYILKYLEVKKIERDMWTEVPMGATLESIYYRYLHFLEDGRVLYALSTAPPHEMIPRLGKVKRTGEFDKDVLWGRYEVSKFNIKVKAQYKWCHVMFDLKIVHDTVNYSYGKFYLLEMVAHRTSKSGNYSTGESWYRGSDVVDFKVPEEHFIFLRNWRL